ncbi:MAG: acetaldehyde dehydrogenase, partial [Melioribacteraceae bacterium]|nr:acetaldehyde dehydrogenase [Melioribacteraceae bacterium]
KYAGFSVPHSTKVLIADCGRVGHDEPLSVEKLSPILAFYTVDGWLEGCHKCIELLNFGGVGHTMSIHSNDQEIIMKFALEKPAFRIVVNSPSSLGAVGYTTALNPSMTLGVGTWGGSIISENVTAKHLMNIKTLAFETNPLNKGNSVNSLSNSHAGSSFGGEGSFIEQIEDRLRARAGNPVVGKQNFTQNPSQEKSANSKLGSGISETEIQKIIREFRS